MVSGEEREKFISRQIFQDQPVGEWGHNSIGEKVVKGTNFVGQDINLNHTLSTGVQILISQIYEDVESDHKTPINQSTHSENSTRKREMNSPCHRTS